MLREFFGSREWAPWAWGGGSAVVALWLVQVYSELWLNDWTARFFRELTAHAVVEQAPGARTANLWSHTELVDLLVEWLFWSTVLLLASPLGGWLARGFGLRWRRALTLRYLSAWHEECGGKALPGVESVAQRIQEDTQRLATGCESILQHGFIAVLELAGFVPVLLRTGGPRMLAVCIGGNALGLILCALVGHKLTRLEYNNQRSEAQLRKELVLAERDDTGETEDDEDAVDAKVGRHQPTKANTASFNPNELHAHEALFDAVQANLMTLYRHLFLLETWVNAFDKVMDLVALVLLLPELYVGEIELAQYMQANKAFNKVQNRLTYLAKRWAEINELLSVAWRLRELEEGLEAGAARSGEMHPLVPSDDERMCKTYDAV